ncbi:MAG: lamin tail domain-containing protein [Bacteroidales bacterium]
MKRYLYIIIIALVALNFTACVEDEIFLDETVVAESSIFINEAYSRGIPEDPDWVELYNSSDEAIDISGYKIYDNPSKTPKSFPAGSIIQPKGFFVIVVDAGDNSFGLSSGGDLIYLKNDLDEVIDNIELPALPIGLSYSRIPDGSDTWALANLTKGTENSNTNEPPAFVADVIVTGMINDNERFQYDIVVIDASGISDVKLWMQTSTDVYYTSMAPMGEGEYTLVLPLLIKDDVVKYYIEATDVTGLKTTFKPADEDYYTFTVTDGLAIFNEVKLSNENPSALEDITVTIDVYDRSGVDAVRLYYLVNDDVADNKINVDLTFDGTKWTGIIPGQADESVIRYYIRATDESGVKSYYPFEELDAEGNVISDFDHDDATTWPEVTVAPIPILDQLVINEIYGAGTPDFIELYNGTSSAIDLGGYKLHDSDPLDAYTFSAGTIIPSGGFIVLNCDGAATTLFKIGSSGEDITLLNPSDEVVDQLLQVNWPGAPLVARKKDGADLWVVPAAATPGTTNN